MQKGSLQIVREKMEWDAILAAIGSYDFYHTFDYHALSSNEQEEPVLLAYSDGSGSLALPLLIRPIPGTEYRDATSVYGYAGPLASADIAPETIKAFQTAVMDFFRSESIVSIFSRLNPYVEGQEHILAGLGEVIPIGKVVNIDLTRTLDEQRSAYRRDTRSRVNKARRLCHVRRAESPEDIDTFVAIYIETMEKLQADDSYFFDKSYFLKFLECDGFKTDILLAIDNETQAVTAGSMFVKTNDIIQYHLSGTKSEFFKIAPARLLLDEMRIEGTERGFRYFNLGGGYQSKEDALFDFKSSFSDDHKEFKVWRCIVSPDIYNDLTDKAQVGETAFFPAYRAPQPTNS